MTLKGGSGGGGGRAGDVRAGGAYYELAVKENVAKELEKAKQKTSAFARYMQGVGQGLSGSLLFGGITGAGVAFGTKVLGPVMDKLTDGLEEAVFATKALAEASKAAADNYSRMGAGAAKLASIGLEEAAGVADPRKAARVLSDYQNALEEKAANLANLATAEFAASQERETGAFLGFGDDRRKAAGERFEAAKAALAQTEAQIEGVAKKLRELSGPGAMKEFTRPLTDIEQRIKDALDPTIAGMGQFERAVLELSRDEKLKTLAGDIGKLRDEAIAADIALKNPGGGLAALMLGGVQAALSAAPDAAAMRDRMQGALAGFDGVRGSFNARAGAMQFGIGDVAKRQEDLLKQIAGSADQQVDATKALADALRMGP